MSDQNKKIQIIVTLGPAAREKEDLVRMKEKGVDFVRVNMSHSTTDDLRRAIQLAKEVGIPFIVDTEGSQVRTGTLAQDRISFSIGDMVRVHREPVVGDVGSINLTPGFVVQKLSPGDILYCDFDSLALRISDVSTLPQGYVAARVIAAGSLGNNKGVYIDTASGQSIDMPPLTPKDHESIAIGLEEGVGHVAASFMRSREAVETVRTISKGKMQIISKIECIDGLRNLDGVIDASDMLLIDRGDLSKEIFLYRIPFTQKIIVHRARRKGKPVVVATNFLESMVHSPLPTRAEIHDIESSITDGAMGLTLAAETAIGKYPFECINVMKNVINHVNSAIDIRQYADKEEKLVEYLESQNYLLSFDRHSPLVPPHGGKLVQRFEPGLLSRTDLLSLPAVTLNEQQEMDAEQIALGAYSPLEGFMSRVQLESVLDTMRLPSGVAWPLPIVLAVSPTAVQGLNEGAEVLLKSPSGEPFALLNLQEVYHFDKKEYAQKLYGTLDEKHPGVAAALAMEDMFLGGEITLLRRRLSDTGEYELTPSQTRRLFESLGWSKVVGFHTRNAPHRGHEYLQMQAMKDSGADGLLIHPVVGKKKKGDFNAKYILDSYALMIRQFYPKNKAVLAAFATYSRYAGPKEALFTALVRQNFGCSHFVVGRDHTGVGDFYPPTASHDIFDQFPEVGIVPLRFNHVFYSKQLGAHVHEKDDAGAHADEDKLHISGTEARKMLQAKKPLPEWFMRPEVSQLVIDAIARGEEVFVQ